MGSESLEERLKRLEAQRSELAATLATTTDAATLWAAAQATETIEAEILSLSTAVEMVGEYLDAPNTGASSPALGSVYEDGDNSRIVETASPPPEESSPQLAPLVAPSSLQTPSKTPPDPIDTKRPKTLLNKIIQWCIQRLAKWRTRRAQPLAQSSLSGEDGITSPPLSTPQSPQRKPHFSSSNMWIWMALASGELLLTSLMATTIYAAILLMRGYDAFDTNWWHVAMLIVGSVAIRTFARARCEVLQPGGTFRTGKAINWTRIAAVLGATATVITALIQGGNAFLQYILADQSHQGQYTLERDAAKQKHEQELTARANEYLSLALRSDSYDERLTLLSYLSYIPSGGDNTKFDEQLRMWSQAETARLMVERAAILEILDGLIQDCQENRNLCSAGRAHHTSIVSISWQVGPKELGKTRGREISELGIPIALVSNKDLQLLGKATQAEGMVGLGTPEVISIPKKSSPPRRRPKGGISVEQAE